MDKFFWLSLWRPLTLMVGFGSDDSDVSQSAGDVRQPAVPLVAAAKIRRFCIKCWQMELDVEGREGSCKRRHHRHLAAVGHVSLCLHALSIGHLSVSHRVHCLCVLVLNTLAIRPVWYKHIFVQHYYLMVESGHMADWMVRRPRYGLLATSWGSVEV